jgi:hypothetical protein
MYLFDSAVYIACHWLKIHRIESSNGKRNAKGDEEKDRGLTLFTVIYIYIYIYIYIHIYRVFQKDFNIFYSGHRGHRTWHPVIFFSYGDTSKTLPTNHKLQDRIRAAVQIIDGNKLVSS